jgi:hypothetical protein
VTIPAIDLVIETTRTIVIEIEGGGTAVVTDGPEIVLDVTMPGVQGPAGPQGPQGEPGPPGPTGAARELHYNFASPSSVWEATHDIVITPAVYAYDTGDEPQEGDVTYPTPTTVRIEWAWPMAGRLVLTT